MTTGTRIRRWITTVALVVGVTVGTGVAATPASAAPPDPGGPCAGSKPFPDVPKNSQFCEAIEWGKNEGIIGGFSDGKFRGAQTMERLALAPVLFRYVTGQQTGVCVTGTSGFKDIPKTNPFCNAVRWGKDNGIFYADGSGNFRPNEPVKRSTVAVILYRSVSLLNLPGLPIVGCVIGIFPQVSILSGFSDVGLLTPYCSEMKFMKDFNISQGWAVPGNLPQYRPTLTVERQALIAFLFRFDQVFFT